MVSSRALKSVIEENGESFATASNLPVYLDDASSVWFVEVGAVEVFVIPRKDGRQTAAPQHLLHAEAGSLLFGSKSLIFDQVDFTVVAKGLQGTRLRRVDIDVLHEADNEEIASQIDQWIRGVSSTVAHLIGPRPKPDFLAEPRDFEMAESGVITSRRGVVWLPDPFPFTGLYLGLILSEEVAAPDADLAIPLAPEIWVNTFEPASFLCRSTKELVENNIIFECIERFHTFIFASMHRGMLLVLADDANLQRAGIVHRNADAEEATTNLASLLSESGRNPPSSELFGALEVIGRHENINFQEAPGVSNQSLLADLQNALDVSSVRCRRVVLRSEENWWVGDGGALLGFRRDGGTPVALLPGLFGRYWEFNPGLGSRRIINSLNADSIETDAFMFYAPFQRQIRGLSELVRLARCRVFGDLSKFFVTGVLGGLVMLLPALLVGFITERIIPENDKALLLPAIAGLATFAFLGGLLHVLQGTALVRMEGRITVRIEAALWDRILRLPSRFLNRYPVGDIAARGMAFRALRDSISGAVADSLVSVVFLFPAFALMVLYDPVLGGVTTAFGILSLIAIVMLARRQIPLHRRVLAANRKLAGLLFQLVNGVSKIQSGCAETSAFARWAQKYREQKRAEVGLATLNEHLIAFSTAAPIISAALLLAITDPGSVQIGDFLVIFAALTIFQAAVLRLGISFTAVASIIPIYELMMPILSCEPEGTAHGEAVTDLTGAIRFDRVSFSYQDGRKVLDEVSIEISPGEFIAITGESGSGKSTLFRIALGIEAPSSGAVYFDGRDMANLNLNQLRRRIGAAPQDTVLMPENIRDNLVGEARYFEEDDVWHAARLAAIDAEIERMPMGMSTAVGLCRANLSGGECQRIQIAAALLGNPRIVMLDESTNWLDNESQLQVMQNIERLSATRLIIAHRLSTLQKADRIYVMDAGRIVQRGTFDELTKVEGRFNDLMKRQIL